MVDVSERKTNPNSHKHIINYIQMTLFVLHTLEN